MKFPKESTPGVPKWGIYSETLSVPSGVITVTWIRKIQKEPKRNAGSAVQWYIHGVLDGALIVNHFWRTTGTLWENPKDIQGKLKKPGTF